MTSKLPNTTTSIFSVMSKLASDHNAINLAQGFPGFESDPVLIDLVNKAMKDGYNQYAPMPGDKKLREVISKKIESLYYKKYNADREITITAGATQAIFTAIAATIHKDDEVIIFTPAYDCYKPSVELFGGKTVEIQLQVPDYKPDWKKVTEKVTEKTKMIIINMPHNPTGMLFSEDDMLQLQKLAEEHDLLVLSDEVYEHIVFDGEEHQSAAKFPQLAKRSFITASFGKTFHNTGWKMGYCVAPEYLMKEFQKVHQFNVFSVNHPIQKALATYLQDEENYLSLPSFYQQKRDYFLELIKDSRFKFTPSNGTYFQLLDFSKISEERDIDFADRLTREHKIATIPTSVFNENNEDFKQIRVCFAKTDSELKKAAAILNSI
ncbi:methionine aminotransferase [Marixanthomonas ophiurae]|uniref:Aminotransferase class I/II-fold pyridoxal phosphate-dependent enzyme n=1 Tax=Marixanthomonas ophiurae TaxID=387659 RepID=A0A3E1QA56_9FLAO|nr:methionine aminotransferase [Marixanthomonas ophiurae]RFN59007.1 aminotransferase class I/II-fold pyridoxal phosphate-dependent enzyme [Marixanthomonas ophiurae]